MVSYWLLAAMAGPSYFEYAQALLNSWMGLTLLFCWSWAGFYHLGNGIRHLCWDLGLGFTIKATYRSGTLVVISSLIFTLLLWSNI